MTVDRRGVEPRARGCKPRKSSATQPIHGELGSRDSNPDFLVNSQARYLYNTPQKISKDGGI